jgi:hypothetical protein
MIFLKEEAAPEELEQTPAVPGPCTTIAGEQAALAPRDFLNLHRFIQSDDRQMKDDLFRCLAAVQLIAACYAAELAQTPPPALT